MYTKSIINSSKKAGAKCNFQLHGTTGQTGAKYLKLYFSIFFIIGLWLFGTSHVWAQTYILNSTTNGSTVTTCSGTFYDSGVTGNYGNYQNYSITFCATSDEVVTLTFTQFQLENNWDYLYFYDGPSTASPTLGSFTGSNSPGQISSTGNCLTVRFTSDGSVNYAGWMATISCSEPIVPPIGGGSVPACPSIDAVDIDGNDAIEISCTSACAELVAVVPETGATTSYVVNSIPYDPPFPFTGGTSLFVGSDDIWSSLVTLPFNFCFYGNMYSHAVVGANGLISFNASYAGQYCPWSFSQQIPNPVLPTNSIFGAYHDIDPSVGGNINHAVLGEAPCRTFVVNFNNVPQYGFSCPYSTTQQIVIYETTNIIDVYIANKPACTSWNSGNAVIGLQNATGTTGIAPPGRNTGVWSATNEAWRFTPNGTANYSVSWYDEDNQLIGTGLSVEVCPDQTTTYTGEVVYEHCDGTVVSATDEITVSIVTDLELEVASAAVSCPTVCDGSITVTVINGEAPFTFNIGSGDQSTGSFNDLCAGIYDIEVTDANNCSLVVTVEVEAPPSTNPGLDGAIAVCEDDGPINLFEQLGGNPDSGGEWFDPSMTPTDQILDPATAESGDYTYQIGDGDCIATAIVQVTISPVETTTENVTVCAGETVILPDGTTVTDEGTYTTTLTTAEGCDAITTTIVTVNPVWQLSETIELCGVTPITLPDGTVVTEPGIYETTLTSSLGCDSTITTEIILNTVETPTAHISGGAEMCPGEVAEVQISFGGDGPWTVIYAIDGVEQAPIETSESEYVISTESAGIYTLTSVSNVYCPGVTSGTAMVVVHQAPTGTMSGDGLMCAGEDQQITIDFTGSGNWTFVITHNGEANPPLTTDYPQYVFETDTEGVYALLSVSDDNCPGETSGQAIVEVSDLPTANLSGDEVICENEVAALDLTLTGVAPWTIGYTINGVLQPPITINTPSSVLETNQAGTYELISVADQHCIGMATGTASVVVNPLPSATISGGAILCEVADVGFQIDLTGTGPWTIVYSIDGVNQPAITVNNAPYVFQSSQEGTYIIESVQDQNCNNSGAGSASLEYPVSPTATITGGGIFCPQEMGNVAVVLTGNAPWTLAYAINGEVFGPVTTTSSVYTLYSDISGDYTLLNVQDAYCEGSVSGTANVQFHTQVQSWISAGGTICPGESFPLSATAVEGVPPYSYQWFNTADDTWVQFGDSITVSGSEDAEIYVVVTDQCGTEAYSDTSVVHVSPLPMASFNFEPRYDVNIHNTTIQYSSATTVFGLQLLWEFYELTDYNNWNLIGTSTDQHPTFTYPDNAPGVYQACLYVLSPDGCSNSMCLPLHVHDDFTFYMPTAFTPNEDGINDLFGPVMHNVADDSFEFIIVNRWGETVFYTTDINQKWDGSGMNGTHYAIEGVYSWRVKLRQTTNNDTDVIQGTVNLIR